jgi:ATP-dependent phosphofructokinase / diphosphate-dependent phosphofructokinase
MRKAGRFITIGDCESCAGSRAGAAGAELGRSLIRCAPDAAGARGHTSQDESIANDASSLSGARMSERNLLVIQGGGPTQVLNATLAAIVGEGRGKFDRILGATAGVKGCARNCVVDLSGWTQAKLELLRLTPGAALGSTRAMPTADDLKQTVEMLRSRNIHDVLFIGGNGTMRGAETLGGFCRDAGHDVRVLGVPKTVDNDIVLTDRCPGYASAARYIAQSTQDLGLDVRSLPQPVSILETMGRSVGWLAAAAAAGKKDESDAPHLLYLPERPFVMSAFLADLDRIVSKQGWAIVVAAEGIRDAKGKFVFQVENPAQNDALERPITGGVAQFLAEAVAHNLKIRCRSEKPGLLGRASMLHVSGQDLSDAELAGRAAVRSLLKGETGKMVSLLPLREPGEAGFGLVPLDQVAGVERPIPEEWIGGGAIPPKEKFFQYLEPLIGSLMPYCAPLTR